MSGFLCPSAGSPPSFRSPRLSSSLRGGALASPLPSHPSHRRLLASYKDAANLFILTSRDGMPRSAVEAGDSRQPASSARGCMHAGPPGSPKYRAHLSPSSLPLAVFAYTPAERENRRPSHSDTPRRRTFRTRDLSRWIYVRFTWNNEESG